MQPVSVHALLQQPNAQYVNQPNLINQQPNVHTTAYLQPSTAQPPPSHQSDTVSQRPTCLNIERLF